MQTDRKLIDMGIDRVLGAFYGRCHPNSDIEQDQPMDTSDTVALITGANRGLGAHLAHELLTRGARHVYVTAREPQTVAAELRTHARVTVLPLDVTDDDSVARAADFLHQKQPQSLAA